MKTIYTKSIVLVNAILLAIIFQACSPNLSYQEAMDKNRKNLANMEQVNDAHFLVEAKSYNMLLTEVTRLALEKGYSAALVSLAKKNEEEHRDMDKQLNKLAGKKKMKLPATMKAEHQILLEQLSASGRSEFDIAFVDLIRRINQENTDLYSVKASEAADEDIRAFAARKLTMFRAHADEIANVDDQLLRTQR